jgi:hypothetical protein
VLRIPLILGASEAAYRSRGEVYHLVIWEGAILMTYTTLFSSYTLKIIPFGGSIFSHHASSRSIAAPGTRRGCLKAFESLTSTMCLNIQLVSQSCTRKTVRYHVKQWSTTTRHSKIVRILSY